MGSQEEAEACGRGSAPRARSRRARAPALACEKNITRKVRRPKRAARNGRKVRLGGPEPNDAWIVQPQTSTHLHEPTSARGDHVTRPLHIAPVGHGDHELRAAGECNNGGAVVPSALASDVMDDRQRRSEPRKGTHHGIGKDSVYAPHEARETHGRDASSDPRQDQRACSKTVSRRSYGRGADQLREEWRSQILGHEQGLGWPNFL